MVNLPIEHTGVFALEALISQQDKFIEVEDKIRKVYAYLDEVAVKLPNNITDREVAYIYKNVDSMKLNALLHELSLVIRKRTNLLIRIEQLPYGGDPFIVTPVYNIAGDSVKDSVKQALSSTPSDSKANQVSGTVDYNKVWVTGDFAEAENTMFLDVIRYKFITLVTPQELTWAILHETGHAFDNAVSANKRYLVNNILESLNHIDKNAPSEEIAKINQKVNILGLPVPTKKASKNLAIYKIVLTETIEREVDRNLDTAIGVNSEDNEASADQFAARFGYGVYAGTAMQKFITLDNYSNQGIPINLQNLTTIASNIILMKKSRMVKASGFISWVKSWFFDPKKIIKGYKNYRDYAERLLDTKIALIDRLQVLKDKVKLKEIDKSSDSYIALRKEMKETLKAIKQFTKFMKLVDGTKLSKDDVAIFSNTKGNEDEVVRAKEFQNMLLRLTGNDLKTSGLELTLDL